jgi:starch-binding outer membrane protein, SusD/RagB family
MKKIFYSLLIMATATVSCTKLDEGVYDRQVADQFYATPEGINSALANIYNEVRGDFGGKGYAGADRGWFDLNETCTDELMLPTRSDGAWADNGIWRQMYLHQWTPAHEFMNNTWNWLYRGVYKANLSVELLAKANADPAKLAEAKVLRAFFYYILMDGWGSVPFYTENNVTASQIPQKSRAEIYAFVVSELVANVDKLSTVKGGEYYGRFNKWAGYALLAKVYLNAQVYTGTPKWNEAAAACDVIINGGGFSLNPNYLSMFGDVCPNDEVILAIFMDALKAPRNIIGIRSLHGPQGNALFGFSTWNGATVHQDFVNKYNNADGRKAQWITGAQAGGVSYSLNISSITSAGIQEGARNIKFLPVAPYNGGAASNDFPIYRYADVLLMKAEALVRSSNAGAAKALYDQVRSRAGLSASAGNPSLDDIYDERGRELCWEGHRRQDMIRFGKFLLAHDFKAVSDNKYLLFPIPSPAIDANRNLVQNPGY